MAVRWVPSSINGGIPVNAIEGGRDKDGSKIYIGRTTFHNDLLPVKVVPNRREAYVAYDGKEHKVTNFEVMCQPKVHWEKTSGTHIPSGAVEGGRTSSGEILYVGRVNHMGTLTVGKVHPSHGSLYIGYNGEEVAFKNYEILVAK